MVGHANVLHNERVIHTAFGNSQDSVVVGGCRSITTWG